MCCKPTIPQGRNSTTMFSLTAFVWTHQTAAAPRRRPSSDSETSPPSPVTSWRTRTWPAPPARRGSLPNTERHHTRPQTRPVSVRRLTQAADGGPRHHGHLQAGQRPQVVHAQNHRVACLRDTRVRRVTTAWTRRSAPHTPHLLSAAGETGCRGWSCDPP